MILPAPAIEIIGLAVTALAALIIVWKGLIVPALLGLLVYAWTCLMADRFVGVRAPAPGSCDPVQVPLRRVPMTGGHTRSEGRRMSPPAGTR